MADKHWKVELLEAALHLQRDHLVWARFMKGLEGCSRWNDDNCIAADWKLVQIMQGRAQQMRYLLKLLQEAETTLKSLNSTSGKITWPSLPNQIPT